MTERPQRYINAEDFEKYVEAFKRSQHQRASEKMNWFSLVSIWKAAEARGIKVEVLDDEVSE